MNNTWYYSLVASLVELLSFSSRESDLEFVLNLEIEYARLFFILCGVIKRRAYNVMGRWIRHMKEKRALFVFARFGSRIEFWSSSLDRFQNNVASDDFHRGNEKKERRQPFHGF